MIPTGFKECTKVLGPPPGWSSEDCGNLPVQIYGAHCFSVWELSDEELEAIKTTRKVKVGILLGGMQPPMTMEVYGVNAKEVEGGCDE